MGEAVSSLPKSVDGLYDSYKYHKEYHEDEVNGDWTDEYVQFTKDGKNPFRADVSNGKIVRFKLEAGSSYIKTKNGHYVGYPARKLTREQNLKWTYYYDETPFASDDEYIYELNHEGFNTDEPASPKDIKATAKIDAIYHPTN